MDFDMELRQLSWDEIRRHETPESLWFVIDSYVFDVSSFVDLHPGGASVLLGDDVAGKDVTELFFSLHRAEVLMAPRYKRLVIGQVQGEKSHVIYPRAGGLSEVPYAEPPWLVPTFHTPFFKDSHRALQKEVRWFFDTHVKAEAAEREVSGEAPSKELMELMGTPQWHIHRMRLGPGPHLHGLELPGGLKGEDFDYFHELVVIQELVRIGAPGYMAGLQAGAVIGAPPLLNFGSPELQREILPNIFAGKKFISLAISEAQAGSDVQGMHTRARRVKEGDEEFYIVTGAKKWITQGMRSDYFMTGVRTGERGSLSMLLIPRTDDVETKKIATSYSPAAGTAYVTFDNAKVPARYLLGDEGRGLAVVLSNFNVRLSWESKVVGLMHEQHERWVINCRIARYSRLMVEETFKWAHQRSAFGERLVDQPAIRQKLAAMFAKVEAGQAWLEDITYQMTKMPYKEQSSLLAGRMAALKYYLSHSAGEMADQAVQIFGGRGITINGMGRFIEQWQRTEAFDKILGGSEEILADLAVRQAMKKMPLAVL